MAALKAEKWRAPSLTCCCVVCGSDGVAGGARWSTVETDHCATSTHCVPVSASYGASVELVLIATTVVEESIVAALS